MPLASLYSLASWVIQDCWMKLEMVKNKGRNLEYVGNTMSNYNFHVAFLKKYSFLEKYCILRCGYCQLIPVDVRPCSAPQPTLFHHCTSPVPVMATDGPRTSSTGEGQRRNLSRELNLGGVIDLEGPWLPDWKCGEMWFQATDLRVQEIWNWGSDKIPEQDGRQSL